MSWSARRARPLGFGGDRVRGRRVDLRERLVLRAENAHDAEGGQLGKKIGFRIFGDEGSLACEGDQQPASGRLELARRGGAHDADDALPAGFAFENYDQAGLGPESLRAFVDAARPAALCGRGRPRRAAGGARGPRCTGRRRAGRWRCA